MTICIFIDRREIFHGFLIIAADPEAAWETLSSRLGYDAKQRYLLYKDYQTCSTFPKR